MVSTTGGNVLKAVMFWVRRGCPWPLVLCLRGETSSREHLRAGRRFILTRSGCSSACLALVANPRWRRDRYSDVAVRSTATVPIEAGGTPLFTPLGKGMWVMKSDVHHRERKRSCGPSLVKAGRCRKRSQRKNSNRRKRAENGNTKTLKLYTYNMFSWTHARGEEIMDWDGDIVALQETKLDQQYLEKARSFCSARNWTIYHGSPSPVCPKMKRGNKRGVGVLTSPGLALQPVKPNSPTWTKLNGMGRIVVVKMPPTVDLPRGVWIISVYAPLQSDPQRKAFNALFWETLCEWDMQIPMIMLGDWNGQFDANHATCPLLMKLLGPGGPFLDAHDLLKVDVGFTYYS